MTARVKPDEIQRTVDAMRDGSFWTQAPTPTKAAPYTSRACQRPVATTLPAPRPEQHDDEAAREAEEFTHWLNDY
jgi:hypothetical protein